MCFIRVMFFMKCASLPDFDSVLNKMPAKQRQCLEFEIWLQMSEKQYLLVCPKPNPSGSTGQAP